jgi:two-component system sensor histidine kinase KdpD
VVYGREKAERALQNFFQESTLVALRELALRQTAHEVEHRAVDGGPGARGDGQPAGAARRDKILALITPEPETAMLIRRARRVADFMGADSLAITVQPSGDLSGLPDADREALERHLNFARNLHLETRILEGDSVAATMVDFARRNQVTQIFLARSPERRWRSPFSRDLLQSVVALAKDMQIVIVSPREPAAPR